MLKLAVVANTPPPYRVPMYNRIACTPGVALHVIFCSKREPNRFWDLPPFEFSHTFLPEHFIAAGDRYIHNNIEVIGALKAFNPHVIVTDGFNPTHLYGFLYAHFKGIPHVPMTDGTEVSERALSGVHRAVRRFVFARSAAFLSASLGGKRLYVSYGIAPERCFLSPLCADNGAFLPPPDRPPKEFDFIFCSRIEPGKSPLFALDVAEETARLLGRRVRILFAGSGSLEDRLKEAAAERSDLVDAVFHGFASQGELPGLYQSASLFLFPTLADVWGVVVNEACAAGLPVLVSPHAGVVDELVRDGENGFVCDLDARQWAERAVTLLDDESMWHSFSRRSLDLVSNYTFDHAAAGVVDACFLARADKTRQTGGDANKKNRRVVVAERQLLNYRTAFYQRLRLLCDREGIHLTLLYGNGTEREAMKRNEAALSWAVKVPCRYLLGERICWQPFGDHARDADMVVVMHENKLLYNLWLLTFGRPRRLAFWGHGRNMQSNQPDNWRERFKRWTLRQVDWWFAYTDGSARIVEEAGFPAERITVVQNSVDTTELSSRCRAIAKRGRPAVRREFGLGKGPVALYVGSLYEEKRIQFLLDAAHAIRKRVPGFELVIAGAGELSAAVEQAAGNTPWLHYAGPVKGERKAALLVAADIMLNPGLVGLGVLDSFAGGAPMFTTDCGLHSPEVAYINSGWNGVMTADCLEAYVDAVTEVLGSPRELARLQQNALDSAREYTVENMADRLFDGILKCLDDQSQPSRSLGLSSS